MTKGRRAYIKRGKIRRGRPQTPESIRKRLVKLLERSMRTALESPPAPLPEYIYTLYPHPPLEYFVINMNMTDGAIVSP